MNNLKVIKCQGKYKNCEGKAVALLNKKHYCNYCFSRERIKLRSKRNK